MHHLSLLSSLYVNAHDFRISCIPNTMGKQNDLDLSTNQIFLVSTTILGHYLRHTTFFHSNGVHVQYPSRALPETHCLFLPTGLVTNRVGKRFGFSISILPTNNLAECNKIGWLFNKCSSSSMFDQKRGGSCMEQAQQQNDNQKEKYHMKSYIISDHCWI